MLNKLEVIRYIPKTVPSANSLPDLLESENFSTSVGFKVDNQIIFGDIIDKSIRW